MGLGGVLIFIFLFIFSTFLETKFVGLDVTKASCVIHIRKTGNKLTGAFPEIIRISRDAFSQEEGAFLQPKPPAPRRLEAQRADGCWVLALPETAGCHEHSPWAA